LAKLFRAKQLFINAFHSFRIKVFNDFAKKIILSLFLESSLENSA